MRKQRWFQSLRFPRKCLGNLGSQRKAVRHLVLRLLLCHVSFSVVRNLKAIFEQQLVLVRPFSNKGLRYSGALRSALTHAHIRW